MQMIFSQDTADVIPDTDQFGSSGIPPFQPPDAFTHHPQSGTPPSN